MNLIGDNWIPAVFDNGDIELVGLRKLFEHAHLIRDLSATPPQRVSLMRLLLCITQAALDGPENMEDWKECKARIAGESISYLEKQKDNFDLFGEKPFLQAKNLQPTNNAVLDKLDFSLSSGNNSTLFDHGAIPEGRSRPEPWIALMLPTFQCFSPSGTIGSTTWNKKETSRSSGNAPCLDGSPLHTIIRGENLLDTLHLNLIAKEQVLGFPNGKWGKPIWEDFPDSPEGDAANNAVLSYLGRLVPLSRAITAAPDSNFCTLANGLDYPKFPMVRETTATVVKKGAGTKESEGYLNIDLSKHPWRELGAILLLGKTGNVGGAPALRNLTNMKQHYEYVDIWTGGLAADKGKILDTAEWNFTLPLSLLGETALNKYSQGVELAERASFVLKKAVAAYQKELKLESSLSGKARVYFWNLMDLFPTRVGMFRSYPLRTVRVGPFPHTRGDVPCYANGD